MRSDIPPLEWTLVALNCIVAVCLAVTVVARAASVEEAAASSSNEPITAGVPVLVVVAAGSATDEAVGRPAAEVHGGRLIVIPRSGITRTTRAVLARSEPGRIVVVGGTDAVSEASVRAFRQYTFGSVTRLAGPDRFTTAAEVAESEFTAPLRRLRVMSGHAPAGARGAAGGSKVPVLLLDGDRVPDVTASTIRQLRPQSIEVLGVRSEVSDATLMKLQQLTSGHVTRSS